MKFVDNSDDLEAAEKKNIDLQQFNKQGMLIIEDDKQKVFAEQKIVHIDDKTIQTSCSVLIFRNRVYDPYGVDSNREKTLKLQLKKVNQETFDYYIKYLQTRNSLYMTLAQRSLSDV
jgi:hypothetical protein